MPTKPVIQLIDHAKPLGLVDGCIFRKRISKTEYVNWINKTELTDFVDSIWVHPLSDTYVYIVCCCKREYRYITKADVPASNVVCPCGREIITYGT